MKRTNKKNILSHQNIIEARVSLALGIQKTKQNFFQKFFKEEKLIKIKLSKFSLFFLLITKILLKEKMIK